MARHRIINPDGSVTSIILPNDATPEEIESAILESTPQSIKAANEAKDKSFMDTHLPWMKETTDKVRVKGLGSPVTVPEQPAPAAIDGVTPQDSLVSSPTGENPQMDPTQTPIRKGYPSTDWAQIGREQVHNIPAYSAAALAAAGLLAAPVTGGTSAALAYPALGAMFGYSAGRPIRGAIEAATGSPDTDPGGLDVARTLEEGLGGATAGMGNVPGAGRAIEDFATRQVPNAARWVAGKMPGKNIPAKIASRYTGASPISEEVKTVLKERIPVTKGIAEETGQRLRKESWRPAEAALRGGEEAGATVSRDVVMVHAQEALDKLAQVAPGGVNGPAYQKAAQEIGLLAQYPEAIPIRQAEGIKQYLNQSVKNWETSLSKDLAQAPATAMQKAFKGGMPEEIAGASSDPEGYLAANRRFGGLAELLEKGKETPSYLGQADITHAKTGAIKNLKNRALEVLGRPRTALQEFSEAGVPNAPAETVSQRLGSSWEPSEATRVDWQGPTQPTQPAPRQLPGPQLRLPAPSGGTKPEIMNQMEYQNPATMTPATDIQASQAIMGEAQNPAFPTKISELATRTTSPTLYGPETGPVFTGQEIPWNVQAKEAQKVFGAGTPEIEGGIDYPLLMKLLNMKGK